MGEKGEVILLIMATAFLIAALGGFFANTRQEKIIDSPDFSVVLKPGGLDKKSN